MNENRVNSQPPQLPRRPPNYHSKRKSKQPKFHKPRITEKPKRYQPTIPKQYRLEPTADDSFYNIQGEYVPEFYHQLLWDKPKKSQRLKIPKEHRSRSYVDPRPVQQERPENKSIAIQSKLGDESIKQLKRDRRNVRNFN